MKKILKREDIFLRDPFIYLENETYYLYGTRSETAFTKEAFGFDVYTSADLETWAGPFEIFSRPQVFWATMHYWAPELHLYHGKYYLFATFSDGKRQGKPAVHSFLLCNYVTDGPFFFRTEDGRLHLLWSSFGKNHKYIQALAHSDNDDIDGNWTVNQKLLFSEDGGHGMIFRARDGTPMLTLHSPNRNNAEHPVFYRLAYDEERGWRRMD